MGKLFINLVYHKILLFSVPSILIGVFFLRLFFPHESLFMIPDFGASDVLHLNLPLKYLLSESLKKNEWPLWTNLLAGGFPLLAEGQIGTFYLPNLLLFKYLPTITAYNLNLIIAYLLLYWGMYLFLRNFSFSKISSTFGATIFAFSGFFSVHLHHFNLLQAASLLPFIFWAFLRLWKNPSLPNLILSGFFLSQQIFAGHFQIVFITLFGILIFLGMILAINYFPKTKKIFLKGGIYSILSLIIGIFLAMIQLLPTIELWQFSGRKEGLDFESVTAFPYPFKHLITFLNPYFFGNPATGTYPPFSSEWGIFWENTAYIGIIPIFLAMVSLIFLREKLVKIFFGTFIISLLLVLGKNSPLYFIFAFFPFNLFRVPSKYLLLATFALTVLATFSLEKIIKEANKAFASQKANRYSDKKILFKKFPFLLFLAISFFSIIDEYRFSYQYPPVSPSTWWTTPPQSAEFLKEKDQRLVSLGAPFIWNEIFLHQGWMDLTPYKHFRNSLYPNYNALFFLPSIDLNTGGLIPKRYSFYSAIFREIEFEEKTKIATLSSAAQNILSLASVRFVVSPLKIQNPPFRKVFEIFPPETNSYLLPFYIYENTKAMPRIYFASQNEIISTVEEWYRKIKEEDFLKKGIVLIENSQFLSQKESSLENPILLNLTKENPREIILHAKTQNNGILVLTDTYYPGWEAFLNGKKANIIKVNLLHRGLFLPNGEHEIKFVYRPITFEIGRKITFLTCFIIFLILSLYRVFFLQKVSHNKKLSPYP